MEQLTVLNQLSFWVFAAMMIVGALGVVFNRSIVYSALMLLVTFMSIAAFFVLLNAPFIAAAQILVYGVGLTIVLIFGIMLTGDKPFVDQPGQERPKKYATIPALVALAVSSFMLWGLLNPNEQWTQVRGLFPLRTEALSPGQATALLGDGGITHIATLLFTKYLIPLELASVLLLLAMIGAIILSKRVLPEEEGEAPLSSELAGGSLETDDASSHSDLSVNSSSVEEKETLGVS